MTCIPNCPDCNGSGFIRKDVELGHADFGKLFPCPQVPARTLFDFPKHGIRPGDKSSWDSLEQVPGVVAMRKAIEDLLTRGYGMLYLWSVEPGQAKTVALKIAVIQSLESKRPACYTRMADILENLRSVYGEYVDKRQTAESRLNFWQGVPLLAIDEFEKARETEFTAEKRFALVDARYDMNIERKVGMTIIAGNQDPETFEDKFLRSRLLDGRCSVVRLSGVDMRPAMEWQ